MNSPEKPCTVLDVKPLDDNKVLRKIRILKDGDLDESPENNVVMMLCESEHLFGLKFAPNVSDQMSPAIIDEYYDKINSVKDFIEYTREVVDRFFGKPFIE